MYLCEEICLRLFLLEPNTASRTTICLLAEPFLQGLAGVLGAGGPRLSPPLHSPLSQIFLVARRASAKSLWSPEGTVVRNEVFSEPLANQRAVRGGDKPWE